MAKAKAGAKKAKPAAKKAAAPASAPKEGLLKRAGSGVAKAAAKVAKALQPEKGAKTATKAATKVAAVKTAAAAKTAPKAEAPARAEAPAPVAKAAAKSPKAAPAKVAETAKAARTTPRPPTDEKERAAAVKPAAPVVERSSERVRPRATKLPEVGEPLTRREMEQLLTAGQGRGVVGEGSLKGRLVLREELPHLVVVGRDKRELTFLLQGPDQEVLPAYVDHKVSVSGLIRKTSNHGGVVDVRKYTAKKPEAEEAAAPVAAEQKLRYLSPGEVTQVVAAGMGAGMKGFVSIRGQLEMTGEEYILVVSNAGTRHQVSFLLEGKGTKGLRRMLGQTVQVTGVVDKTSGWGGRLEAETVEVRPAEFRPVSRDGMTVHQLGESPEGASLEVHMGEGLSVRLQEKAGFTWAIEPTAAKRAGLREVAFEPESGGPGWRELFFTPRNLGVVEIEFFLAKALTPAQVDHSWKLNLTVRP